MAASNRNDSDTMISIKKNMEQAVYFVDFCTQHKDFSVEFKSSKDMIQSHITSASDRLKEALAQLKTLDPKLDTTDLTKQIAKNISDIRDFIISENKTTQLDKDFLDKHNATLVELSNLLLQVKPEEKRRKQNQLASQAQWYATNMMNIKKSAHFLLFKVEVLLTKFTKLKKKTLGFSIVKLQVIQQLLL